MKSFSNKKIIKPFFNNRYVLLSSLCAAAIVSLVYFCYNVIPFGEMTVLRMDLYHQYGPLFGELFERWKNLDSMLYSWKSGLGGNFLGNYFNYLSSPFTLIILAFGHKNIPQAISALILVKGSFAAGSFTYYIKKTFDKHDFATAAFGLLYAFCGWFVAFYWNIMWVDAFALFPLIMLGIQHIINKGKPWLYCITLAITLFSNYYMGYMTCIFSVLYFLVYYFSNYSFTDVFVRKYKNEKISFFKKLANSRFLRSGVRFALFSLIAGLLTAISLIPVYYALKACSATSGSFPVDYKSYFKIFDFLANHLAGIEPTIRSSGTDVLPNIYSGMLTIMLIPLYLFDKKIKIKEKAMHLGLLLVLLLSFNINYANYVWHGFHFPNDLPYRFSFMYSFIILIMAYKAFSHTKDFSSKQFLAIGISVLAFIVITQKVESKNVTELAVWISIAFTVAYTLILTLFKNKNYNYIIVALLLLCTCGSEIAVANTDNYNMGQSYNNYLANYTDFNNLNEKVKQQDNGFYRMEQSDLLTRMDNSWYYYNGSSVFSSLAYEKLSNMMRDIGFMSNYINSYTYHPQTAVYNAMFDIKYIFDNDESIQNDDLYESLFGNDTYTVYRNKYVLPLAFGANSSVKDWTTVSTISPFVLQSDLFSAASGVEGVYENIPIDYVSYNNIESFYPDEISSGVFYVQKQNTEDSASFTLEITVPKDENVYIYLKARNVKSITASGEFLNKSQPMDKNYNIIDLGYRNAGEIIYVEANMDEESGSETMEFYAVGLNMEKFIAGYDILSANALNITEFEETDIKGTVNMNKDGVLFTTIPYDEGWSIYIDGEKTSYFPINSALIGVDIDKGEHTVEFRFVPKGLVVGASISAVALLFVIALVLLSRRKNSFLRKATDNCWGYDNSQDEVKEESANEQTDTSGFRLTETIVFDEIEDTEEN